MPLRPVSRPSALLALALLVAPHARAADPLPADPESQPKQELVVWVTISGLEGLAVALNDLGLAPEHFAFEQAPAGTNDFVGVGLRDAIRSLLASETKRQPTLRIRRKSTQVVFKFAEPGALLDTWQPLFDLAAGVAPDLPAAVKPYEPPPGGWDSKLAWFQELEDDLIAIPPFRRVVILGPERSDEVPALYFFLATLKPGVDIPPIISPSASWSVLSDPGAPAYLGDGAKPKPTRWAMALGRSRGYASGDDIASASTAQINEVSRAITRIKQSRVYQRLIAYAQPDRMMIAAARRQLLEIEGHRRFAVLYPDEPETTTATAETSKTPAPRLKSPRPARTLYGPELFTDFETEFDLDRGASPWERNGDQYIVLGLGYPRSSAPVVAESSDPKAAAPSWAERVRAQLLPVLHYFERERIDAIGVFGDSDDKKFLLGLLRERLGAVRLFTSDADWQFESPTPRPSTLFTTLPGVGSQPPKPADTTPFRLQGLMVFTSPQPSRAWVRRTFQSISMVDPRRDRRAFLPSVFTDYTSNITKQLIAWAEGETRPGYPARAPWEFPDDPPTLILDASTRSTETTIARLERFLRHRGELDRSYGSGDIPREAEADVMLIRPDGRLRRLVEQDWPFRNLAIVLIILAMPWLPLVAGRPREGEGRTWRAQLESDRFLVWTCMAAAISFTAFMLATLFDVYRHQPLSTMFWPDGLSLMPSVLLLAAAALLAAARFAGWPLRALDQIDEFVRARRDPYLAAQNSTLDSDPSPSNDPNTSTSQPTAGTSIRPGSRESLFLAAVTSAMRLSLSDWIACWALGLLVGTCDACAGVPALPWTARWAALIVFEVGALTLVVALTLSMFRVGRALDRVRDRIVALDADSLRTLSRIPPESLRKLGAGFVTEASFALVAIVLVMMSRWTVLGMPPWRWSVWQVPFAFIAYAAAVAAVLSYWRASYSTFGALVRRCKSAQLARLELQLRRVQKAMRPAPVITTSLPEIPLPTGEPGSTPNNPVPPAGPDREKLVQRLHDIERQRQEVRQVPDRPWDPRTALGARVAMFTAVVPPLLSMAFGSWGNMIADLLKAVVGG